MELDKDLKSIQQARRLAGLAKDAQQKFSSFSQQQVDQVIKAMADAGYSASERLAKMAVEESGFGKWEDKFIKNQFSTKNVYDSIKDLKTVGIVDIEANGKILKIAVPMGVICALVPSTNPTSTAMFKALISLKCRNGIVASPHPRTAKCTTEALKILSDAAVSAGAPDGIIQCLSEPTIEGTEELMHNKNIAVILATGSNPMVKAAYSSGKPAYGVGSGNVPAFIEKSADYKKAVADIVYGTTFDNGTLCSSEQAMIVDLPLKEKVIEEVKRLGGYFVNFEEKEKLAKAIQSRQSRDRINQAIVGQSARFIANYAGFNVPENTKVLMAECSEVGKSEPLSMEKLSPILAFYIVDGWLDGCHKCIDLLNFGGIGHTMVIHSNDEPVIMKFALEKPAFRILVNTVASIGAVGYTTALSPSMTLGPGTIGGSIVSDNITAKHLMNIKSLAFETNAINPGNTVTSFKMQKEFGGKSSFMMEIEDRLRARAGNPHFKEKPLAARKLETPKVEIKTESKTPSKLGEGILKENVDKIIREFKF